MDGKIGNCIKKSFKRKKTLKSNSHSQRSKRKRDKRDRKSLPPIRDENGYQRVELVRTCQQPTFHEPLDEQQVNILNKVEEVETKPLCYSKNDRKEPQRFKFDMAHGYNVAKSNMKDILLQKCSVYGLSDAQYLHGILLNENGTFNNVLTHCSYCFKASKKKDPNTPNLTDAMSGPNKKGV